MNDKKVLLIDDEAHVVSVIKHFLLKSGYQVETANNGIDALEKVRINLPDIIVSDIQMPKMSGLEFSANFRKEFPESDVLIVIMTSRTERDFREQAGTLDNVEFFEKPLSPKKLVLRLNEYFEETEILA